MILMHVEFSSIAYIIALFDLLSFYFILHLFGFVSFPLNECFRRKMVWKEDKH